MNTHKRFIYALRCPFTKDVHYIGKTIEGMTRPLSHLKRTDEHKVTEWVNELKKLGHRPDIEILEEVAEYIDIFNREKYWVQYWLDKGMVLLNIHLVTPKMLNSKLDELLENKQCSSPIYTIAHFIKTKRKFLKISQEELSNKTNIGIHFIRDLEQCKEGMHCDLNKLQKLLSVFGCTLDVVKVNEVKLPEEIISN